MSLLKYLYKTYITCKGNHSIQLLHNNSYCVHQQHYPNDLPAEAHTPAISRYIYIGMMIHIGIYTPSASTAKANPSLDTNTSIDLDIQTISYHYIFLYLCRELIH